MLRRMCPSYLSPKALLPLGLAVPCCVPIDPALPRTATEAASSPSPAPSPAATIQPVPTPSPPPPSWAVRLAKGQIRTPELPDVLLAPAGIWATTGEAWFADTGGHAVWSTDGTRLVRRAGWGAQGWSGDGGPGPEGQLAAPLAGSTWPGGGLSSRTTATGGCARSMRRDAWTRSRGQLAYPCCRAQRGSRRRKAGPCLLRITRATVCFACAPGTRARSWPGQAQPTRRGRSARHRAGRSIIPSQSWAERTAGLWSGTEGEWPAARTGFRREMGDQGG